MDLQEATQVLEEYGYTLNEKKSKPVDLDTFNSMINKLGTWELGCFAPNHFTFKNEEMGSFNVVVKTKMGQSKIDVFVELVSTKAKTMECYKLVNQIFYNKD